MTSPSWDSVTGNIQQHHLQKLLTAHRHGFATVGQVAASRNSMDDLVGWGLMELRPYQPDKRSKPLNRWYLTEAGMAYIEPIAKQHAERIAAQSREMALKDALEAAAPDMLAELRRLYDQYGHQQTADVIAKATTPRTDD